MRKPAIVAVDCPVKVSLIVSVLQQMKTSLVYSFYICVGTGYSGGNCFSPCATHAGTQCATIDPPRIRFRVVIMVAGLGCLSRHVCRNRMG